MPSKVRNQVKKSLKSYDIKKVPFEDMWDCGFELFNKSRSRFGVKSITLEQWIHKMSQLRKRHHDYWIGYDKESGKPASFAINRIYNDYIDYSTMGRSPDFPNNTYPMYGLIYEMNRWYLEECKVPFVCNGSRSITEHSNIQSLLIEKYKFRKAYCDIQLFYKPWLGVLVKILFPLRCLFRQSKVSAILRQEAWARGLDQ